MLINKCCTYTQLNQLLAFILFELPEKKSEGSSYILVCNENITPPRFRGGVKMNVISSRYPNKVAETILFQMESLGTISLPFNIRLSKPLEL